MKQLQSDKYQQEQSRTGSEGWRNIKQSRQQQSSANSATKTATPPLAARTGSGSTSSRMMTSNASSPPTTNNNASNSISTTKPMPDHWWQQPRKGEKPVVSDIKVTVGIGGVLLPPRGGSPTSAAGTCTSLNTAAAPAGAPSAIPTPPTLPLFPPALAAADGSVAFSATTCVSSSSASAIAFTPASTPPHRSLLPTPPTPWGALAGPTPSCASSYPAHHHHHNPFIPQPYFPPQPHSHSHQLNHHVEGAIVGQQPPHATPYALLFPPQQEGPTTTSSPLMAPRTLPPAHNAPLLDVPTSALLAALAQQKCTTTTVPTVMPLVVAPAAKQTKTILIQKREDEDPITAGENNFASSSGGGGIVGDMCQFQKRCGGDETATALAAGGHHSSNGSNIFTNCSFSNNTNSGGGSAAACASAASAAGKSIDDIISSILLQSNGDTVGTNNNNSIPRRASGAVAGDEGGGQEEYLSLLPRPVVVAEGAAASSPSPPLPLANLLGSSTSIFGAFELTVGGSGAIAQSQSEHIVGRKGTANDQPPPQYITSAVATATGAASPSLSPFTAAALVPLPTLGGSATTPTVAPLLMSTFGQDGGEKGAKSAVKHQLPPAYATATNGPSHEQHHSCFHEHHQQQLHMQQMQSGAALFHQPLPFAPAPAMPHAAAAAGSVMHAMPMLPQHINVPPHHTQPPPPPMGYNQPHYQHDPRYPMNAAAAYHGVVCGVPAGFAPAAVPPFSVPAVHHPQPTQPHLWMGAPAAAAATATTVGYALCAQPPAPALPMYSGATMPFPFPPYGNPTPQLAATNHLMRPF